MAKSRISRLWGGVRQCFVVGQWVGPSFLCGLRHYEKRNGRARSDGGDLILVFVDDFARSVFTIYDLYFPAIFLNRSKKHYLFRN